MSFRLGPFLFGELLRTLTERRPSEAVLSGRRLPRAGDSASFEEGDLVRVESDAIEEACKIMERDGSLHEKESVVRDFCRRRSCR